MILERFHGLVFALEIMRKVYYNWLQICLIFLCKTFDASKQLVYSAFWWIGSSNWRICRQQILFKINQFLVVALREVIRFFFFRIWLLYNHTIQLYHWYNWQKQIILEEDKFNRRRKWKVVRQKIRLTWKERWHVWEGEWVNGKFWESLRELWMAPTSALIDTMI